MGENCYNIFNETRHNILYIGTCMRACEGQRMKKKLSKRRIKWIERTVANDRSNKQFLYGRFFLFLLLAVAQLVGYVFLWYLLTYYTAVGVFIQIAVSVLSLVMILYLINKNDRPSIKLNWIIVILIVPVFGVPAYLLYGEKRPTKLMNRFILKAKEENKCYCQTAYAERKAFTAQTREESICYYLERHADYPVFHDGDVEYFESGEKMFPQMLAELQKAEKYIFVEYFIIAHGKMWGEILKILLEKAALGVKVRIIYDDFGCMMTLPPDYDRYLESLHENIRCMTFNDIIPFVAVRMNNRDHKKVLVVDGKVAFTGGVNLADEYIAEKKRFGYWKDTGIKVTGNAVGSFVKMFLYMWNALRADKEKIEEYLLPYQSEAPRKEVEPLRCIQPYDDSPFDEVIVAESVYLDMIHLAQKYLYIFTPYLLIDDSVRTALCQAARRGVDVRIVTPGIPDKKLVYRLTRANYGILMKAGIRIYEYTPGFIHAKSVLCDGTSAVVGTINFDYRSLFLHFENGVYFSHVDGALAALIRDYDETFAVSKLCTPENTKRNIFGRLLDSVLRVFETLM